MSGAASRRAGGAGGAPPGAAPRRAGAPASDPAAVPAPAGGPLGVFDSGLGGLTVVRALLRRPVPGSIVYFGDTARVPYGNKSAATVTRLSLEAMRFLQHQGVRALVVACNTASAVAMDALVREAAVPVLGVVEAGARSAARATRGGRVGVIGTRATVGSRCYERALERLRPGLTVTAAACPLFVPLVEEGWIDGDVTRRVAASYLAPLRDAGVDTLVLGCTHYPLLREVIQETVGADVVLIDSGEAVAEEVEAMLGAGSPAPAPHRFYVSDQPARFEIEMRRFLGESPGAVTVVDQTDVPWYDRPAAWKTDGAAGKDSAAGNTNSAAGNTDSAAEERNQP